MAERRTSEKVSRFLYHSVAGHLYLGPRSGLRIKAVLDTKTYETGRKVADREMEALHLKKHTFHSGVHEMAKQLMDSAVQALPTGVSIDGFELAVDSFPVEFSADIQPPGD